MWKTQLNILGNIFQQTNTTASDIQENWIKILENVEKIFTRWVKRNLSISWKLCIIKTFLISQFVYPMQALIAPPQILQKLNTILLLRYLWKKKYPNTRAFEKVTRTVVCSSTEEVGINMINVHDMQASFVLAWATTLKQPGNENWKLIPRTLFNLLGSDLACFQATAPPKHFLGIERIRSKFWQCSLVKWVDWKHLF